MKTRDEVQTLAQAMLEKYGFFVVAPTYEVPIGHVFNGIYSGDIPEVVAQCVIVGFATEEDMALQFELAGEKPQTKPDDVFLYRAVAE